MYLICFIFIYLSIYLFIYLFGCRLLNMLKAYVVKALVNSVDHLGCVAYKVNDLFSEKMDEFSETELRLSCLEQVYFVILHLFL